MGLRIWASSPDVPGIICEDARLTDQSKFKLFGRETTAKDQSYGQAGWDVGLRFSNLGDLAGKLETLKLPSYVAGGGVQIRPGAITRLAIHAHGSAGQFLINGQKSSDILTPDNLAAHHQGLHRVGLMTADNAKNPSVIFLMGCSAGYGKSGTNLLIGLSKIWPNRKVVGFITIGAAAGGQMIRHGEFCSEPGMRDTDMLSAGLTPDSNNKVITENWSKMEKWPWASESSPRAKVALNSSLIAGSQFQ